VHGVASSRYSLDNHRVLIVQGDKAVRLDLCDFTEIDLTPEEALHVASKLARVARLIIQKAKE
jgi:hypothetical protein